MPHPSRRRLVQKCNALLLLNLNLCGDLCLHLRLLRIRQLAELLRVGFVLCRRLRRGAQWVC
jgi:hypothetical protein